MQHPDNVHPVDPSFGKARPFYPEATENQFTAANTLAVDYVMLVYGQHFS